MKTLSFLGSVAILSVLSTGAWALDCPVAAAIDDAATAAVIGQMLPADTDLGAPDALQSAVFELRNAGVADDVIVDNLIAVYCASVDAQPDVSDADKTQQVEAFSQTADEAVFGAAD